MLVDQLSLHKTNYTTEEKQAIFQDALFISANQAPVAEYNLLRLSQQCSDKHPVTVIKAKTEFSGNKKTNHFKEENAPSSTMFCVGCLVSICGRNIEPKWGLHNGAIGKVIKIVYNPGTSPLNGDFPAYVVVDFKAYCGPAWDADNPMVSQHAKIGSTVFFCIYILMWKPYSPLTSINHQHIPIPIITNRCPTGCCERMFCPLKLSFAKTIDTFQGQNAGQSRPWQTHECCAEDHL